MIYSLNEIEAHCKKAARGVGLAWGYAEEAGRVARWLAAHQLPGVVLMAQHLTLLDEQPDLRQAPVFNAGSWQAAEPGQLLSPLLAGAVLCDRSGEFLQAEFTRFRFVQLAAPLLLLPYLDWASRAAGVAGCLRCQAFEAHCKKGYLTVLSGCDWQLLQADEVICTRLPDCQGNYFGCQGQAVDVASWEQLAVFAQRTYVPASEASRQGAGPAV